MTEEEVFLAALDLPDPVDRSAYLEKACGGNAGFRRQVEDLLAAHFKAGEFLDEPVGKQLEVGPSDPIADDPVTLHDTRTRETVASEKRPAGARDDLCFLQPTTRPDSLGRIGNYEALQVLGKGGFGIVLRAFDDVLQRVVALKVLAPEMAATSPARKRFLREARSSAQVRHENVVQVYAVEEQPLPYLVMEFIPGETLQQRLDRTGPLEAPEIVRFGRQVAEALAAAHATGLIHRDIKPANVLIESGYERVKVTDFGLARAADDASLTRSGVLAGTPMYMAPEQAKGDRLDHRADLFSLGSVLYVMAAGRPPFRAATTYAVLKRVVEDDPRPIQDVIPEVPRWLCDIIAKLHAKEPEHRFQSAREVADVLADCEAQLKASSEVKDFSHIPRGKLAAGRLSRWKGVAAALLLPVLALAIAEGAGVTHWLRNPKPTPDSRTSGDGGGPQHGRPGAQDKQPTGNPLKYGDPEYTNTLGMTFKLIPAGKFTMGSPKGEIDRCAKLVGNGWERNRLPTEGPEHEVRVMQPFYMGTTEVTVGQYRRFVEEEGYSVSDARWRYPGFEQTDDHPVVLVSWQNAVDFCKWLSEKDGNTYRLPTEAEWEYSCRAGRSGTRYCHGDDDARLEHYGWYNEDSGGRTRPVGKKKPNGWGLFDMHGNVWEWCQDSYDPGYYDISPVKDPPGGADGERVLRGGSWNNTPVDCRSAFRNHSVPGHRENNDGFRALLVSPPVRDRTETRP
jgi:formylglycine-generating enzyme required for sulfatase activity